MPIINQSKYTFSSIFINYKRDAYDVYTEGIRFLINEVPREFYIKCDCGKRIKVNPKDLFRACDVIITCKCKNMIATSIRSSEDCFIANM